MGGNMSRNKGAGAEREIVKLLQPIITDEYAMVGLRPVELQRNLMQAYKTADRQGKHDLVGVDWMALEVKRHETLAVNSWWEQAVEQAGETQEPVLFYRPNFCPWKVRMYGYLLSNSFRVKCTVDLDLESFLTYFRMRVRENLQGSAIAS